MCVRIAAAGLSIVVFVQYKIERVPVSQAVTNVVPDLVGRKFT